MTSEADRGPKTTWLEVECLRVRCLTADAGGTSVLLLYSSGIGSAGFSYKHFIEPLALSWGVRTGLAGIRRERQTRGGAHHGFYVGFLGRLMDTLRLERVSFVSISLGGAAALGFTFRSPQRVERLVLVDIYSLGNEVPWGRLGYLLVHAPLLDNLMYALVRCSCRMVRWSLYNLLHDRRVVTEEMVEEVRRLVNKTEGGPRL